MADIIFKADFYFNQRYLTWKTGVETLSSTFLAAVTHLTLHQPSALCGRARLLPHCISATATHRFPSWLLPSYKEANRNTTSLSLALKVKNCVWGEFLHFRDNWSWQHLPRPLPSYGTREAVRNLNHNCRSPLPCNSLHACISPAASPPYHFQNLSFLQ